METSSRNSGEETITLRQSCSSVNKESPALIVKTSCKGRPGRKWHLRSIGSSSLLIILIWEYAISCSLGLSLYRIQYLSSMKPDEYNSVSLWLMNEKSLIGIVVLSSLFLPVVGLLSQVAIGRYKLISYFIKILWIFSVIASIISICEESLPVAKPTMLTVQLLIIVIPNYWFLGAFLASAIPLGMDQITGGTVANISSFIQWLAWAFCSGLATSSVIGSVLYDCTSVQSSEVSTILSLLPVLLLSVGLILDFCFHQKLVKEPVTVNPVSLILKVLKYAAKHKHPVQRSAFTYCENERPTRLDYGKSKYGGPFTTEQVEDVKTFWRMLVVILVLSTFALSFIVQMESVTAMEKTLSKSSCIEAVVKATSATSFSIAYLIPLHELLVYPCLRNRGPSILQSAGIGAAALVFSSLYGLMTETAIESFNNSTSECMFTYHNESKLEIASIPFNILLGFTALMLYKSSIEFVCAQAPYNMQGILIGLYFNFETVFFTLGAILYEVWKNNWMPILDISTCGIWFYLTALVLAVVSSALLGLVIRWYKARERDETTRSQDLVEEVYHKYKEQAQQDS